jgi:methionyl aminopeptidase
MNLLELEHHARDLVAARGATSCYWDYAPSFGRGPFRNVICLSVNDAVLHGMPHHYVLRDGDVLSLDFAVSIDGWVADSAVTGIVGDGVDDADAAPIDSTRRALDAGVAAAVPGGRLGDISAAIGDVAAEAGYRVNVEFGGHGLGRTMHEDPHIPNRGRRGRGLVLRPGMPTAGRCARPTARTPRTPNTPSPSPVTGRAFSLNAPCGRINDLRLNSYPHAIIGSAQLHTQMAAKTQVIARINR